MENEEVVSGLMAIFEQPLSTIVFKVIVAILILIIGRWISKLLIKPFRRAMTRGKVDETLTNFFSSVLYYLLLLIIILIALGVLGVPTTSIIAILGAATLAIGLALKDSISNLAAGISIIVLRPFQVGDYIQAGDEEGWVREIKFVHTTLLKPDNKFVYVPNNAVMQNNIINYSKEELIRLDLVYGIGYDDDVVKAKQLLESIVYSIDLVAREPVPLIAVKELGDSSVNLIARFYVRLDDAQSATFKITELVKLRFDEVGISMPFPQRDVHLYQPN